MECGKRKTAPPAEPVLYYRRRDEATSGANVPASLRFVKTKRIGTRSRDQGGWQKPRTVGYVIMHTPMIMIAPEA